MKKYIISEITYNSRSEIIDNWPGYYISAKTIIDAAQRATAWAVDQLKLDDDITITDYCDCIIKYTRNNEPYTVKIEIDLPLSE